MSTAKLDAVSFKDSNGAAITVPADQIALYSTIKSDQLNVLNRIIADRTAGFNVDFDDVTMTALTGLAGELAHACNEFMCVMSMALHVPSKEAGSAKQKGGAK